MSQPQFWYDTEVSGNFTTTFIYLPFGFIPKSMISITSYPSNTDDILYSWDGTNVVGRIQVTDAAVNLANKQADGIYIKANSGTQGGRVMAY